MGFSIACTVEEFVSPPISSGYAIPILTSSVPMLPLKSNERVLSRTDAADQSVPVPEPELEPEPALAIIGLVWDSGAPLAPAALAPAVPAPTEAWTC